MSVIFKRTKILATVGPATDSYEAIEAMASAGVNGFRLNFSHETYEAADRHIEWVRKASEKLGKPVAILQDLQGPKIRLGNLNDNHMDLKKGDELTLAYGATHEGTTVPIQYNLAKKVKPGEPVYLFDGKVRTVVTELVSDTAFKVRVENDGFIMSRKGINLPDTNFGGDILTEKDIRDIGWGVKKDFDYVALSFVQAADDITNLRKMLDKLGSEAQIIAKVETKAAIEDETLEEIVKVSDGIMVARDDLAVEAGAEVVPIAQRKMIALCRKYGKLSIVATQMMASMVDAPEPTRAEVSDVANAVIQGADTVMLSDESANGSYPMEAVASMKRVILYTQDRAPVSPLEGAITADVPELDAIAASAVRLAEQLKVGAIIAKTKTGATACAVAAYRPNLPIVSITSSPRTAQQLALRYANRSYLRDDGEGVAFALGMQLKGEGYFGDVENVRVAIVSGRQPGVPGTTDTIRVRLLQ